MNKYGIAAIVAIIVITLVGAGALYLWQPPKPYEGKPESITVGTAIPVDASALIYIADDQHYFEDNGLNVTIKMYDAGLYAVDDMFKGNNDVAVATEFVFVDKVLHQEKVDSIGSISKYQIHYLTGRKDRGIENVSDVKGKKIGYTKGTSGEFYLSRYLELHSINLSDVTMVDLPPALYADAIENGTLDAVCSWEPFTGAVTDRLGTNAISWSAQSGQLGYWNAICTDGWAEQHPEIVNRFLKSMDQAVKFTIYHPEEAKAIVQNRSHADNAYLASAWANTQFTLSLDQSLIMAMEDEGRWMIKNNLTAEKSIPDFRDYIYLDGMKTVKPESVNIVG